MATSVAEHHNVTVDPAIASGVTALVPHVPAAVRPVITFDEERLRILTNTIMPTATPPELDFFKLVCQRTGLDPFAKQIHAVKRTSNRKVGNRWESVDTWSFQVAIDGFRLIAERTGKYRGQTIPQFCGPDGQWRDVWLDSTPPRAARVGVLRSDFDQPLYAVALWDEYVQLVKEYEGRGNDRRETGRMVPNSMWAKMPTVMLAKVAEALALRKAFPQEMSGLYTDEEMAQADNPREEGEQRTRPTSSRNGATVATGNGPSAPGATMSSSSASSNPTTTSGAAELTLEQAEAMTYPWAQPPKYSGKPLRDVSTSTLRRVLEWAEQKIQQGSQDERIFRMQEACALILSHRPDEEAAPATAAVEGEQRDRPSTPGAPAATPAAPAAASPLPAASSASAVEDAEWSPIDDDEPGNGEDVGNTAAPSPAAASGKLRPGEMPADASIFQLTKRFTELVEHPKIAAGLRDSWRKKFAAEDPTDKKLREAIRVLTAHLPSEENPFGF